MPMDLYERILKDARSNGIAELILGGYSEPTMDQWIVDRVEMAKTYGMNVQMVTNATRLDRDLSIRILESGLDSMQISIDGATKETYESIRKGGKYHEVVDNVVEFIRLRDSKPSFKTRIELVMTVSELNSREVKSFREQWTNHVRCGYDTILSFVADSRASVNGTSETSLAFGNKSMPCIDPFETLFVMSDGRVPMCCKDYDGTVVVGDLRVQTVSELRHSLDYLKLLEIHLNGDAHSIPMCVRCGRIFIRSTSLKWLAKSFPRGSSSLMPVYVKIQLSGLQRP
jgi:hypothetical protein